MNRRDLLRMTTGAAAMSVVACTTMPSGTDNALENQARRKTIATRLSKALNTQHPLVCAAMSFVCDKPDMCIAVSQSGGVGALAASLLSPPVLASSIDQIRTATDKPFHVGFLSVFPYEQQLQVCIDKKVPIVSFHYGLPSADVISRLHAADIAVWVQVGDVSSAEKACELGVDGLIAQGHEAGGHTYAGMPLMALLPAIRDVAKDKLLLAAGGIADGRTVTAALAAGADGVWVGTSLVATDEANAHADYKRRLVEASGEDTIITHVYGPEFPAFNPMRIINNDIVKTWQTRVDEIPKDRSKLESIGRTLFAGQEKEVKPFDTLVPVPETTGDFEQMPMLAGQGVGLVTQIQPVKTVIEDLMHDAATVLEGMTVTSS